VYFQRNKIILRRMVTGIETAGLVLAAFPILMEVLSSAHTVKEIWRYRVTLRMLRRAIRVEKCKFEEIWYYLLQLAGEDPNAVGDPPWSDEFQKKLLAHLRESSRVSFVDACEDLNTILGELNEKLGQNENNDIVSGGYEYLLIFIIRDETIQNNRFRPLTLSLLLLG